MAQELNTKRGFSFKTLGPLWPPRYLINFSTKEARFRRSRNAAKRTRCSGKLSVNVRAFHPQLPESGYVHLTDYISVKFCGYVCL